MLFSREISERHKPVLTSEAIAFLAALHRRFEARRRELLAMRVGRLVRLKGGEVPDFLPETEHIRRSEWTVAPLPPDLLDRRVEITGPVDRKMIINAMNSGARVFMADFEDSTTPTWENLLNGQVNLRDAVHRTISFQDSATGKEYRLREEPAVLFVRPRGWHLDEKHVTVDGVVMPGSLFDFGLYAFHNAAELLRRGSGPYFYLPKLENHLEARLWNEVFTFTGQELGLPHGSIKATVLVETILAAFEMDEILWELRDHSAGLNCGRWDYIFSFIKKFAGDPAKLLPDRSQVTMTTHFLRSYSRLAIKTCHRRGVSAMGGMSAVIPIKNDPEANDRAMAQVRADKEREATDGHDGTWVAHPALVPIALGVFDRIMPQPNQLERQLPDFEPTSSDLLQVPAGQITIAGVRQNVAVGLGYVEAWLRGIGCVPLFNLMEDAATAEISRAQLWQWIHHGAVMNSGEPVTEQLVVRAITEQSGELKAASPERSSTYEQAAELLTRLVAAPEFFEFLTEPAYEGILRQGM